jgi:hypothetical protein
MLENVIKKIIESEEELYNLIENPESFIKNHPDLCDQKEDIDLITNLSKAINLEIEKNLVKHYGSKDDEFREKRLLKKTINEKPNTTLKNNEYLVTEVDSTCGFETTCYYNTTACTNWCGQVDDSCPTDSTQTCIDDQPCTHQPLYPNFCVDSKETGACMDFLCYLGHCADSMGCIDAGACINYYQCIDKDVTTRCRDSGCQNGITGGNVVCSDQINCLDEASCANSTNCEDIGENAKDLSCSNTTFCSDSSNCHDGNCNNDTKCVNNQCNDGICNNNEECTDTNCTVSECTDGDTCVDTLNCISGS